MNAVQAAEKFISRSAGALALIHMFVILVCVGYWHKAFGAEVVNTAERSSSTNTKRVLVCNMAKKISWLDSLGRADFGIALARTKFLNHLIVCNAVDKLEVSSGVNVIGGNKGGHPDVWVASGKFVKANHVLGVKNFRSGRADVGHLIGDRRVRLEINTPNNEPGPMGRGKFGAGEFSALDGGISGIFGDSKRYPHIFRLSLGHREKSFCGQRKSESEDRDENSRQGRNGAIVTLHKIQKVDSKRSKSEDDRANETLLVIIVYVVGRLVWKEQREIDKISAINGGKDKNSPQDNEQPTRHD